MDTPNILRFIITPVLAYLLGSIPSGLLLTRLFTLKDIRNYGSGNIGATNVKRIAGTKLGLATLVADAGKGVLPVALVKFFFAPGMIYPELFISVTAFFVFLGHLYPCYLKFSGGKGVATAAGCFMIMSPLAFLIALAVFLAVAAMTKHVSSGSLCGALALPFGVWWTGQSLFYTLCALIMAGFIFLNHSENIQRLLTGKEPKVR